MMTIQSRLMLSGYAGVATKSTTEILRPARTCDVVLNRGISIDGLRVRIPTGGLVIRELWCGQRWRRASLKYRRTVGHMTGGERPARFLGTNAQADAQRNATGRSGSRPGELIRGPD